jgi:thiamine-monophosphate kinase
VGEFDLIERYFKRPVRRSPLGVGDDCALLAPGPGMQLAVSCDMLVEGRHFFVGADPRRLGHKSLAVNLSDLAACGADPLAFTLALALPQARDEWLAPFAAGLFALADEYDCELVGGDTTRGPLTICITVFGQVPTGQALLRSGAKPGDDVFVSGTLGDARLALEAMRGEVTLAAEVLEAAKARLDRPTPRVALGLALRGVASAAIDVSDGLAGDLGHILAQSGVGARLESDALLATMAAPVHSVPAPRRLECVLAGGDDYELAFTAPPDRRGAVADAARAAGVATTRVGRIEAQPGLRVVDAGGEPIPQRFASFDHFG